MTAGSEEIRSYGAFDVEFKGRIADLDSGDFGDLGGAEEGFGGDGGETNVLDLALILELFQPSHGVFNRRFGIGMVEIV